MSFFKFSIRQRQGFVVLILICSLFLIGQILVRKYFTGRNTISTTKLPQIAESSHTDTNFVEDKSIQNKSNKAQKHLFEFDPNTISQQEWIDLGLKPFLAQRIEKYIQKGGKFKIKSDLKRIYGFNDSDYQLLKSYILLPDTISYNKNIPDNSFKKNPEKQFFKPIDINLADSIELIKLPGIGTVLAARIVKYRNKLGGFHSINQLMEVYGLKPEAIQNLEPKITINLNTFVKVDINNLTFKDLAKHPYVGYRNAKLISAYKNQHGKFTSETELLKVKEIDNEKITKLLPYLEFR